MPPRFRGGRYRLPRIFLYQHAESLLVETNHRKQKSLRNVGLEHPHAFSWNTPPFVPVPKSMRLFVPRKTPRIWPLKPGPSVYVVGLRVTGLVITTIPAIVIRPELPTTGLNTSLTDPNGQWTATAKAKIIEKNDTYWEFSFFVDMANRTNEEQEYTVKIHFVDADGFSVEDRYAGDVFNKIPANSTKRLLDQALIDTENASTVVGILLEVNVR